MTRRLKRPARMKQRGVVGPAPAGVAESDWKAAALFAEAMSRHQAGQIDEAEALYRQLIALDPSHLTSLHNLAVIACQTGRQAQAVALFDQAIAVNGQIHTLHNNRGNALKDLGRFDEAAASYARALALEPDFATTHYNIGNLHLDQGRLGEAAVAYRQAITLNPGFGEAYYNLANVLRDLGRLDEAEAGFRRAIALRPDHAQSHNNLGNLLKDTLRLDEAAGCYLGALAAQPNLAIGHNNLGVVRQLQGRLADAMAAFRRALELNPDFAEAHNNLGVVLQDLGELEAAAGSYRQAIAVNPGHGEAHHNLVRLKPLNDGSVEADQELELLVRVVADSGAQAPAQRGQLLFALGKAFEDRKAFDRSFACLAEANALRRADFAFDIGAAERRLTRVAETFDVACLARLRQSGLESRRPIFIVGMPRSGTTLIEQIISAHPDVHGAGELPNLPNQMSDLRGPDGSVFPACIAAMSANECREVGQTYLDSLDRLAGPDQRVTDKWLSNFEQLGLIEACLPNATVIHCLRDPRDVGLSCFAIRFVQGQEYAYDLAEMGRYWRAYDRLMDHWRSVLRPGWMLEVPYEAVVEDVEGWARRLIAHCGLEWNDACLRYFESGRPVRTASSAQVRRPIYTDSVGRRRRFGRHLGPLLEALGKPWAEAD